MPWRISRMTRQWTRDRLNLYNDLNQAAAFWPLPYFFVNTNARSDLLRALFMRFGVCRCHPDKLPDSKP